MSTFLARCTTLGLLAGGFMLTGDAGWLMARGTSLLNSTTIPVATETQPAIAPVEPSAALSPPPSAAPPVANPTPAPATAPPLPAVEAVFHPTLAAPAASPPADGGLNVIDLRLLRAGDRLLVWVAGMPTTFDIVDPSSGEAIQQPTTRRVRIASPSEATRLLRGGTVIVRPVAGITGHAAPPEQIGPVQALTVQ